MDRRDFFKASGALAFLGLAASCGAESIQKGIEGMLDTKVNPKLVKFFYEQFTTKGSNFLGIPEYNHYNPKYQIFYKNSVKEIAVAMELVKQNNPELKIIMDFEQSSNLQKRITLLSKTNDEILLKCFENYKIPEIVFMNNKSKKLNFGEFNSEYTKFLKIARENKIFETFKKEVSIGEAKENILRFNTVSRFDGGAPFTSVFLIKNYRLLLSIIDLGMEITLSDSRLLETTKENIKIYRALDFDQKSVIITSTARDGHDYIIKKDENFIKNPTEANNFVYSGMYLSNFESNKIISKKLKNENNFMIKIGGADHFSDKISNKKNETFIEDINYKYIAVEDIQKTEIYKRLKKLLPKEVQPQTISPEYNPSIKNPNYLLLDIYNSKAFNFEKNGEFIKLSLPSSDKGYEKARTSSVREILKGTNATALLPADIGRNEFIAKIAKIAKNTLQDKLLG